MKMTGYSGDYAQEIECGSSYARSMAAFALPAIFLYVLFTYFSFQR